MTSPTSQHSGTVPLRSNGIVLIPQTPPEPYIPKRSVERLNTISKEILFTDTSDPCYRVYKRLENRAVQAGISETELTQGLINISAVIAGNEDKEKCREHIRTHLILPADAARNVIKVALCAVVVTVAFIVAFVFTWGIPFVVIAGVAGAVTFGAFIAYAKFSREQTQAEDAIIERAISAKKGST